MKALELLYQYKQADEIAGGYMSKPINEAIKDLLNSVKEQSEDRLAKLEKVILDYYLAKGYQVGVSGWEFIVNISTYRKQKEIQIMFIQDVYSNWETVFRINKQSTKEMFDAAFEYFSIKE